MSMIRLDDELDMNHRTPTDLFTEVLCLCAAAMLFGPGCTASTDSQADRAIGDFPPTSGVGRAARLGTAQQMSSATMDAPVVASAFIIAKFRATEIQREIAQQRARAAYQQMPPKKKSAVRAKKIALAVRTEKDKRFKGTPVMLWDTNTQDVIGDTVYDVGVTPESGTTMTFEAHVAEYIGGT